MFCYFFTKRKPVSIAFLYFKERWHSGIVKICACDRGFNSHSCHSRVSLTENQSLSKHSWYNLVVTVTRPDSLIRRHFVITLYDSGHLLWKQPTDRLKVQGQRVIHKIQPLLLLLIELCLHETWRKSCLFLISIVFLISIP